MNFNLAKWCIKRKELVYFFIVLIALAGIFCFKTLGRSEDPNFVIRQMVISCAWPGATPEQMQQQVTSKIEKIVQSTPDIDYISSYSRPGVCVVNVILREQVPNKEVRKHWLEIRNYVQDNLKDLPQGIYGPYYNDRFDDVYGNIYALTSDSFSFEEMRVEAENIKRIFFTVPDVKKAELIGVQPEKIYLQIDNNKLAQLGLNISTLKNTILAETSMQASGNAIINKDNVFMRLTGAPNGVEALENIIINANGVTVRLKDIALITKEFPDPPMPLMYFNGKPAVGIAVSMEEGGNNITLGKNLNHEVEQIKKQLPLGLDFNKVADQPQVVDNAIGEFTEGLYEAILIVLAVSLFTLGRQSGYVISVCIPLVLMGSFIGMYALGIDLHKISLGALIISLGMLVDDAIVVVELMEVKMSEGWDRLKAATYAFETCSIPLLFGTMITCCSFMPIAFSNCNISEFAGSLFPVISITLMFSWFISATVAPTLGYAWIKPTVIKPQNYDSPFYNIFRTTLNWCLNHRKSVMLMAVGSLLVAGLILKIIPQQFFPVSVRPEVIVELNLPEGSSINKSNDAVQKLMSLLKDDPDMNHLSAYVGKSAPRFVLVLNPVQPRDNFAQLVIVAKDIEARYRLEKKVNKLMKEHLPEVIGYSRSIPLGPPTPYPVMFRVSSENEDHVKLYAQKVRDIMSQNPNLSMIIFDWMEKSPTVKFTIDTDKLQQMGLSRQVVANTLQAGLTGYTVAQYYENDQALDVIFRLNEQDRTSIEELGNIVIPTPHGPVPLNQLAKIEDSMENNMIWRRDLLPTITVNGGVIDGANGNDVSNQVWEAMADLRKELPPDVKIEVGGDAENSSKAINYLLGPVPLVLGIITVLLMLQMQSVKQLFVIFCTAPLCLIGIAVGLLIFNAPMNIMARVGAFALVGTVIRNSMVIVDQIVQHQAAGMPLRDAIIEAAIVRYRPIMLAALTTILGLIPMFISPFWNSMAIAMSCGLTGATALTLLFLPTLYAMVFQAPTK